MPRKTKTETFLKDPTWYKDAVIYQVHVKSYFDANDDGIGDFNGLIAKLDYIAELGVNAIWLLPFYPSPMRDDGYDIAEYRDVYPPYGTMADARRFISEAHRRGLRVITELVINHTSDQHQWFQRARMAKKGSVARDFYVWSDTNQRYQGTRIIFSDTENSNWTWDPVAGQYFWHRFYSNQPDLNFDNPEVLKAVLNIMRFWFDIGVDGLRLDAIPYLVEREGTTNENLPETHQILKKIRAELNTSYPDRMLLAEANLWPEDIRQYFGNGDECHMAFHFPLMPRMYMAIAQEDRFPIVDILRQMPEIPENCQWAIFLRNHDELTLEMVTDQERDYLWNYYAADKRARINLGIRRRLAPLVERDRRRIELLNSLLLSMPGTPTLYYGDEIGMGDNIFLGDRHGVRTPMQWSMDRNGGFSRADPASLVLPATMDPLYGFQAVNVESQARDSHSLLNWTRRMLAVRKQQRAFGRGSLKMLAPANRRILAYLREYTHPDGGNEIILCVANMSRAAQAGELDLSGYAGKIPVEMIGGTSFPPITKLNYLLTLPPYGFYWFLLADEARMPNWHVAPVERMPELPTLIIKQDLIELLQPPARTILESESLPAYLPKCPWYRRLGELMGKVQLNYAFPFGQLDDLIVLMEVEVTGAVQPERYHLALGFVPDHQAGTLSQQLALARLRQKRTVGLLTDAFTLPEFSRTVIRNLRAQLVQEWNGNQLHFIAATELAAFEEKADEEITILSTQEATCSVVIGQRMVLKPIRHVKKGAHPEIEINVYLQHLGYTNIAPVLGEVRRIDAAGHAYTLMILQEYLNNQGDAWHWTQNTLERAIREQLSGGTSAMDSQYSPLIELENFAKVLGRRLGEMHLLLAQPSADHNFGCREVTAEHTTSWACAIIDRLEQVKYVLTDSQTASMRSANRDELVRRIGEIKTLIEQLSERAVGGVQMRVHGNFHLAQALVVRDDAYFVNFGAVDEQLNADHRYSPLKDVASMLGAFDDAAAVAGRNAKITDLSIAVNQISQLAVTYQQQSRTAFLQAYRNTAGELLALWPNSESEAATLSLFFIDNRLREILRARHHSDWLEVPTQGLIEIINKFLDNPEEHDG